MVYIIKHWIPDLKQGRSKYVYTAKQCPQCPPVPKSKSFRLNTKIGVWKCYQCGNGGRNIKSFLNIVKPKKINRHLLHKSILIESYYSCQTLYESELPF